MRKYFIDLMNYCYPCETDNKVNEFGVLSKYIGKTYNRDEMDKIICELFTRHPYIEGSMWLYIRIMYQERENVFGYYHTLSFTNDNYKKQNKGSLEIKYEK